MLDVARQQACIRELYYPVHLESVIRECACQHGPQCGMYMYTHNMLILTLSLALQHSRDSCFGRSFNIARVGKIIKTHVALCQQKRLHHEAIELPST